VQSGVKRSLIHLQDVLGYLLDPFGNSPSMHPPDLQGSQNKKVQGSLEEIDTPVHNVDSLQQ
jgi:hypothetical protein